MSTTPPQSPKEEPEAGLKIQVSADDGKDDNDTNAANVPTPTMDNKTTSASAETKEEEAPPTETKAPTERERRPAPPALDIPNDEQIPPRPMTPVRKSNSARGRRTPQTTPRRRGPPGIPRTPPRSAPTSPAYRVTSPGSSPLVGRRHARVPGGALAKLVGKVPDEDESMMQPDDELMSPDDEDDAGDVPESATELDALRQQAKAEFEKGTEDNRRYHRRESEESKPKDEEDADTPIARLRQQEVFPETATEAVLSLLKPPSTPPSAYGPVPGLSEAESTISQSTTATASHTSNVQVTPGRKGGLQVAVTSPSNAFQRPRSSLDGGDDDDKSTLSYASSVATGLAGSTTQHTLQRQQQSAPTPLEKPLLSPSAEQQVENVAKQMKKPSKTMADLLAAIVSPSMLEGEDNESMQGTPTGGNSPGKYANRLTRGYMVRRKNACGALQVLTSSRSQTKRISIAWTVGVLPALTSVLQDAGPRGPRHTFWDVPTRNEYMACRQRAVSALVNLSTCVENRLVLFHSPGLVPALIATLLEDQPMDETKKACCTVLHYLSKTVENRLLMVQAPGFVSAVSTVLHPRVNTLPTSNEEPEEAKHDPVIEIVESQASSSRWSTAESHAEDEEEREDEDDHSEDDEATEDEDEDEDDEDDHTDFEDEEASSEESSDEDEDEDDGDNHRSHHSYTKKSEDSRRRLASGFHRNKAKESIPKQTSTPHVQEKQKHQPPKKDPMVVIATQSSQRYDSDPNPHVSGARQNVFALLGNLVKEKDNAYHLARSQEFVDTLVEIAKLLHEPSHALAVRLLAHLTRHRANSKPLVFEFRHVVPVLVSATQSSHGESRKYTCLALQNLTQDKAGRQALAATKSLLPSLCRIVRSKEGSLEERTAALQALKHLTDEPANLIPMTNTPECLATLMQMAHASDPKHVPPEMQYLGCDALATLSHWFRSIATSGQRMASQKDDSNAGDKKIKGPSSTGSPAGSGMFVPSLRLVDYEQWH